MFNYVKRDVTQRILTNWSSSGLAVWQWKLSIFNVKDYWCIVSNFSFGMWTIMIVLNQLLAKILPILIRNYFKIAYNFKQNLAILANDKSYINSLNAKVVMMATLAFNELIQTYGYPYSFECKLTPRKCFSKLVWIIVIALSFCCILFLHSKCCPDSLKCSILWI